MTAKRSPIEIHIFLKRKGIKQVDIARAAGVDRSTVSRFISGVIKAGKVLAALKSAGVPARYLG